METHHSTTIDHLGLVSGMIDQLQIIQTIDNLITQDFEKRKITVGTSLKALVLIGLGFTQRRLYLAADFFKNKPTDLLFGNGITADMLTDDTLGRALDEIHAFGTTPLFSAIAQTACKELNIKPKAIHLDSSSFHTDGRYNSDEPEKAGVITITHGYSRDHRPDLNQVILNLITDNVAGIPLHMQALSGNQNDKTSFAETVKKFADNLKTNFGFEYCVADSALFTQNTIQNLSASYKWISRVPETITEARDAMQSCQIDKMISLSDNYKYSTIQSNYGKVPQRWLIVWSKDAYQREIVSLQKRFDEAYERENKEYNHLKNKQFACKEDALSAYQEFAKKHTHCSLGEFQCDEKKQYSKPGKPSKEAVDYKMVYTILGSVSKNNDLFNQKAKTKGLFIIASNECDTTVLSNEEMLQLYKNQHKVEGGFRFLKDPQFMATELFLKKPERIEAVMMVMVVSLLVYAALEYQLRQKLEETDETVPDQKRKPIKNPTMRWVFALFDGIHILTIENNAMSFCLNLNSTHKKIISLFGLSYAKYYLIV